MPRAAAITSRSWAMRPRAAAGTMPMPRPCIRSPPTPSSFLPTSPPPPTGWWRHRSDLSKGIAMDELSARRLRNVIPVLVEQRNILIAGGVSFAGHLVDLAIIQLRLSLNEISEDELSEFSDVLSVGLL